MKDKIINAALAVFSQKGYNASLNDISNIVGIKKQSLYNYFENKEALFKEVVKYEINTYLKFLMQEINMYKSEKTELFFKKLFYSIINHFNTPEKLKFWRVLLILENNNFSEDSFKIIKDAEIIFIGEISSIFKEKFDERKMEAVSIENIYQTYLIMMHGVLDTALFYNHLISKEELLESVWTVYWNSVKTYAFE